MEVFGRIKHLIYLAALIDTGVSGMKQTETKVTEISTSHIHE